MKVIDFPDREAEEIDQWLVNCCSMSTTMIVIVVVFLGKLIPTMNPIHRQLQLSAGGLSAESFRSDFEAANRRGEFRRWRL